MQLRPPASLPSWPAPVQHIAGVPLIQDRTASCILVPSALDPMQATGSPAPCTNRYAYGTTTIPVVRYLYTCLQGHPLNSVWTEPRQGLHLSPVPRQWYTVAIQTCDHHQTRSTRPDGQRSLLSEEPSKTTGAVPIPSLVGHIQYHYIPEQCGCGSVLAWWSALSPHGEQLS